MFFRTSKLKLAVFTWDKLGGAKLGVDCRVNNPTSEKKHVKKPQNKPRNWINGQRPELENGIKIGTWNRKNGKHENGVGFVVSDDTLPQVKEFTAVNDRICYIRLSGHIFDSIIVNAYAPTEEKEENIKNEFYDELGHILDTTPNSCIKILIGDFNAKIGKEDIYRPTIGPNSLHDVSNDNGTRLINLCITNGFTLSSTYFPRKDIYKQTWMAPNRITKNQIDHVLIQNKHKGCIKSVRSYRGADADSDHYLVITKLKIRLSERWKKVKYVKSVKYDIEKLSAKKVLEEYVYKTQQELQKSNSNADKDGERIWDRIKTAVVNSANNCLGIRKREKRKEWFNDRCKEAIDRRNRIREKTIKDPSDINMERFKNTKKETNKVLRCEKRLAEKRKIEEIEENKNNSRRFFSKTANIKQGFKPQTRILRNELGELVTKEESVVEEFKKHFERLLNKTPPIPTHEDIPMQYSTAEPYIKTPTKQEIYNIIKKT
ncbi:uncharacterized protein LOC111041595 [Myzus persicae]|uniref:uncharacterized protein LOC111041595 n=1 Tax=Myzus persicae TaxID=13164 RepID=UPI000B931F03|nr:uncharacterized protein LOC111041595 [Myzus persicae]